MHAIKMFFARDMEYCRKHMASAECSDSPQYGRMCSASSFNGIWLFSLYFLGLIFLRWHYYYWIKYNYWMYIKDMCLYYWILCAFDALNIFLDILFHGPIDALLISPTMQIQTTILASVQVFTVSDFGTTNNNSIVVTAYVACC